MIFCKDQSSAILFDFKKKKSSKTAAKLIPVALTLMCLSQLLARW